MPIIHFTHLSMDHNITNQRDNSFSVIFRDNNNFQTTDAVSLSVKFIQQS